MGQLKGAGMGEQAELLTLLNRVRAERGRVSERFGIEILGVSGSKARGDDGPDSDLDLGVRKNRKITLFEVVNAKEALSIALGFDVDLVFVDFLNAYKHKIFMRDLVPL